MLWYLLSQDVLTMCLAFLLFLLLDHEPTD